MSVLSTVESGSSTSWSNEGDSFKRTKFTASGVVKTTHYRQADVLGKGSGFNVYLLKPIEGDGRPKALKISKNRTGEAPQLITLENEFTVINRLKDDCKFYANYLKHIVLKEHVVLSRMDKTLHESHHQLSFVDLLLMVDDLSKKLLDIHNAGVIHCDINLWNIMSDKNGKYQFIDFGYSSLSESCPSDVHRRVGKAMDVFCFSKEMNALILQHLKDHPASLTKDLQEKAENIAIDYDSEVLESLDSKKEIQQLQSRIEAVLSEIQGSQSS